ncbi:Serine/threonine-protein kinase-transforming protein Rmil [Paragonimus heterotremus]|uniref:non-specific serine/threonine protein kinase n=1 Tax=Paragonimus heterotremus TaxID=100268 RepID=A0A8J4SM83_9TREM|nr:Serine/threonine-protein kinase-transforming protein Rmil [Paragonimus heterotremus]
MSADSGAAVALILQQRCCLLDNKIKNFSLVSKALQMKTDQLVDYIEKQEDYCGLLIKEYDEVSNDINSVQAVIEKYSRELEELRFRIKQCLSTDASKNTQSNPSTTNSTPQLILPPGQTDQQPGAATKLRLRAHLPNSQFTLVEIRPGQQIQHALGKKLSHRGLQLHELVVHRAGSGLPVSWEDDAVQLALSGEELVVDFARKSLKRSEHHFQRKTFFDKAHCSFCQKFIFHGIICKCCGLMYHQRCLPRIDMNCVPVLEDDVFYTNDQLGNKHFYGTPNGSFTAPSNWLPPTHRNGPGDATMRIPADAGRDYHLTSDFLSPHGHQPRQYLTLTCRERSSSTPNVSNNMITPVPSSHGNIHVPGYIGKHHENNHNRPGHTCVTLGENSSVCTIGGPGTCCCCCLACGRAHAVGAECEGAQSAVPADLKPSLRSRLRRDSNEEWEIPSTEITKGPRIGSGSFGTVFKGYWHGNVAIKELNVTNPNPQQLKAFKNEVNVLRKTRHVNILLFMGCVSKPCLAIITQWCEGSSLYKHLHVLEGRFDVPELVDIARQTSQGMDYLHAKHIIHRDLKSSNIFLHERTVKIGDFGLATVKSRWWNSGLQQPTGSIFWMAPEVIRMQGETPYTNLSDVYAFGIVVCELITGQLPYSRYNNRDQILFLVGRGLLKPDISEARSDIPPALRRLAIECCSFERDDRPPFSQIHQRLDSLYRSMPKLHRCASEPSMNAMRFERTDTCELTAYLNVSPKTPLNSVLSDNLFFFSGRTRDAPDSKTPVVDRSSDSTCLLEEEEDHKPSTHHPGLTES